MKKKLAGTWKKIIRYWRVQMNGNKFATGQILGKPVEVVKGRIVAGGAPKSPEPWLGELCKGWGDIFHIVVGCHSYALMREGGS